MSTSAAKAKAKREAEAAAVAAPEATERTFTPEEMELLGIKPTEPELQTDTEPELQTDTEPEYAQLWRGGRGVKQFYVIATSEEEAIAKLIEKDSILGAIGCSAEVVDNIDGYTIVAAK